MINSFKNHRANSLIFFILFMVIGTCMTFYPTLFSGFVRIQSDIGDSRFSNYLLEHSYQWITSNPMHNNYWDAPMFYPARNTIAYSDMLLGVAPFYWIFRPFFLPDTAFQIWLILMLAINYAAFYLLLTRCFGYSNYPSCVGALFFSYSLPRVAQLSHAQVQPEFYILMSIYGLYNFFWGSQSKKGVWICLFFLGIILQIITGIYLAFFWCIALCIFGTVAIFSQYRTRLVSRITENLLWIFCASFMSFLILSPVIFHYVLASMGKGFFPIGAVQAYIPNIFGWLYVGVNNAVYGSWMRSMEIFQLEEAHEKILNIGYLTSILTLYIAVRRYHKPLIGLLVISTALSIYIFTVFPVINVSIWGFMAEHLPLLRSVRAVGRIVCILLIPIAIFVAEYFETIRSKWLLILLTVAIILEQFQFQPSFDKYQQRDKIDSIANMVLNTCTSFYYGSKREQQSHISHLDAMWASLKIKIPTTNGYSAWNPNNYGVLGEANATTKLAQYTLMSEYETWSTKHFVKQNMECFINN